jgi:hypothetical protein
MASSQSLAGMRSPAESVRDAIVGDDDVTPLSDEEIKEFLDDLDHNNDGNISYEEIEYTMKSHPIRYHTTSTTIRKKMRPGMPFSDH